MLWGTNSTRARKSPRFGKFPKFRQLRHQVLTKLSQTASADYPKSIDLVTTYRHSESIRSENASTPEIRLVNFDSLQTFEASAKFRQYIEARQYQKIINDMFVISDASGNSPKVL